MVQIMAGLITYLFLAIHCYEHYDEFVSIKIQNKLCMNEVASDSNHAYVISFNYS